MIFWTSGEMLLVIWLTQNTWTLEKIAVLWKSEGKRRKERIPPVFMLIKIKHCNTADICIWQRERDREREFFALRTHFHKTFCNLIWKEHVSQSHSPKQSNEVYKINMGSALGELVSVQAGLRNWRRQTFQWAPETGQGPSTPIVLLLSLCNNTSED